LQNFESDNAGFIREPTQTRIKKSGIVDNVIQHWITGGRFKIFVDEIKGIRSLGTKKIMRIWPRELGAGARSISVCNVVDFGSAARRLSWVETSVARKRQVGGQMPAEPRDEGPLLHRRQNRAGVKSSMVRLNFVADETQLISCYSRKRIRDNLPKVGSRCQSRARVSGKNMKEKTKRINET
jgi:hypothetical protein